MTLAMTDDDALLIRPHRPGDLGWVIERHAALYAADYGWDGTFEAAVAEIAAELIRSYDPARDRCFIAERGGQRLGSAALVADRDAGEGAAKIRLVIVDPAARGLGLGRKLVRACLSFAVAAGYREVTLWTFDILKAACRIYETEGFTLSEERPITAFGQELGEQIWRLDLASWR